MRQLILSKMDNKTILSNHKVLAGCSLVPHIGKMLGDFVMSSLKIEQTVSIKNELHTFSNYKKYTNCFQILTASIHWIIMLYGVCAIFVFNQTYKQAILRLFKPRSISLNASNIRFSLIFEGILVIENWVNIPAVTRGYSLQRNNDITADFLTIFNTQAIYCSVWLHVRPMWPLSFGFPEIEYPQTCNIMQLFFNNIFFSFEEMYYYTTWKF